MADHKGSSIAPNLLELWCLARVLSGSASNGELEDVSSPYRCLLGRLAEMPMENRHAAFKAFVNNRSLSDADKIIKASAERDSAEPAPISVPEMNRLTARLGDLTRPNRVDRLISKNWLVRGHLNLLSPDANIGKTYFAMDLARRVLFGEHPPDSQTVTSPEGKKTLWPCEDRQQEEQLSCVTSSCVPHEADQSVSSPAGEQTKAGANAQWECDIPILGVEWLWTNNVPLEVTMMFCGDPKQGRWFVTCATWIAGWTMDVPGKAPGARFRPLADHVALHSGAAASIAGEPRDGRQ